MCPRCGSGVDDVGVSTDKEQIMDVEMEDIVLPDKARVKIEISVSAEISCTDVTAQRKVSRLLLEHLGGLLYGERPTLVAGRHVVWRVPIWLGMPGSGPQGQVGTLDVDVQSGEILYNQKALNEIAQRAYSLAGRSTSSAE